MKEENEHSLQPGDFEVVDIGRHYNIPAFQVKKQEGLVPAKWHVRISFVRGSRDPDENITATEGVTHESLLEMQIADLQHKSKLLPSAETAEAIKKLQEALMWLRERARRRDSEGKLGTYRE